MQKRLYIVVGSLGGVIETAEIYTDKREAVKQARAIWRKADIETDDVKVIAEGAEFVWGPRPK